MYNRGRVVGVQTRYLYSKNNSGTHE